MSMNSFASIRLVSFGGSEVALGTVGHPVLAPAPVLSISMIFGRVIARAGIVSPVVGTIGSTGTCPPLSVPAVVTIGNGNRGSASVSVGTRQVDT